MNADANKANRKVAIKVAMSSVAGLSWGQEKMLVQVVGMVMLPDDRAMVRIRSVEPGRFRSMKGSMGSPDQMSLELMPLGMTQSMNLSITQASNMGDHEMLLEGDVPVVVVVDEQEAGQNRVMSPGAPASAETMRTMNVNSMNRKTA